METLYYFIEPNEELDDKQFIHVLLARIFDSPNIDPYVNIVTFKFFIGLIF